jgi:hypothetical protein
VIIEDPSVFPGNIVQALDSSLQEIDPDIKVFRRPLRPTDPVQSIGIVATQWIPNEESYEMRGAFSPGAGLPTIGMYLVGIQVFVKDMDEVRGLAVHCTMSQLVKSRLFNDPVVRLSLSSLTCVLDGVTEKAKRWGVRTQRFVSNEISGQYHFLSSLEFWLETETH